LKVVELAIGGVGYTGARIGFPQHPVTVGGDVDTNLYQKNNRKMCSHSTTQLLLNVLIPVQVLIPTPTTKENNCQVIYNIAITKSIILLSVTAPTPPLPQ